MQEYLEKAIEGFSHEKVEIFCAGRTDAGVHALAQVAHFDLAADLSEFKIRESLNAWLRDLEAPVSVVEAKKVEPDFHARFSAKGRGDLTIAERYMPEIAAELIERGQGRGEIWNVNFPSGPLSELRGILRERFIAPMQLYNGVFTARLHPEGHALISQKGVPIEKGAAPAGSDIAAVLDGYISIGKIKSPVMTN